MRYPTLNVPVSSRDMIQAFGGYNHNLRIAENEFYDMKNLTSDHYPVLSPRSPREDYPVEGTPYVMIQEGEKFCYATDDSFYIRNTKVEGLVLDPLSASQRSLVAFGSYIIIFPDRKFVNVNNPEEYGDIDASFTSSGDEVSFELCKADGSAYSDATLLDTEPENPSNQQLWIDTSASPHTLKQFSAASGMWVAIATTYVKISAPGIGVAFEQYDGVEISGIESEALTELNSSMVIWDKGDDYIVVVGILDKAIKQTSAITISRKMPKFDFIVSSGNRLWGCRYYTDRGNSINEIRCSKLGDFKNWNCFMGISTDSYVASLGESGRFTGATVHLGYPMFFRENCIHKIYGDMPSQFQIQSTICDGVGYGCNKSLVSMNGTLFYKSNTCVCAYDGSLPVNISKELGDLSNQTAVGGRLGEKYYIRIGNGNPSTLFVYDTAKGFWHKEDERTRGGTITDFCTSHNRLRFIETFLIVVEGQEPTLKRTIKTVNPDIKYGRDLETVEWMAETGIWGIQSPDKKYVSKLSVRMSLALGSVVFFYAQYDSSNEWEPIGKIIGTSLNTFTIPVRPKRCDHFRLRIEGSGEAKILSITKTIEEGSDI